MRNLILELRERFSSKRLTRLALALAVGLVSLVIIDWRLAALWIALMVAAEARRAMVGDGMGLGLVPTRRLMELMGGEAELIRSAPGLGSSFALTIAPAE
ncbi:MAG: hypothetical protein BroJett021_52780 [Chloroflexota bacterium]|nr:hypothetical protein [Hyphomonadaceae bacterium]GIK76290.1 MAG: hypothetical protein BroJett021_52780 [Chloroflexota bacterium]